MRIVDEAVETFLKTVNNGENPVNDTRDPDIPVGLKVMLPYSLSTVLSIRRA